MYLYVRWGTGKSARTRERGESKGEEKEGRKVENRDHSIVSDYYYNNST
jgi:hypothetical protein